MLLMIDNYDSFTFNLVQYFGELGETVHTVRNDAIDTAVRLTEQAGEYGTAGVLVTGSVVTAGEARALLAR